MSSSSTVAAAAADKDVALLDRVFLRLAMCDTDDKTEAQLQQLLVPLLAKAAAPSPAAGAKLMEILSHINKVLASRPSMQLPTDALAAQLADATANAAVKRLTVLYLRRAVERLPVDEQQTRVPALLRAAAANPQYRLSLTLLTLRHLGTLVLPTSAATADEMRAHLGIDTPSSAASFCSTIRDVLLLANAGTQPGLVLSPDAPVTMPSGGLSRGTLARMWQQAGGAKLLGSRQAVIETKLSIVEFLRRASSFLETLQVLPPLLAACGDAHDRVCERAETELRRRNVDIEDTRVLAVYFNLFLGTVVNSSGGGGGGAGGANAATPPPPPPDERRQPGTTRHQAFILQQLLRSRRATNTLPYTLQIVFTALWGKGATERLRVLGMQFLHRVFELAPLTTLNAVAQLMLKQLLKLIEELPGARLEGLAYTALGKLAHRCPRAVAGDVSLVEKLFDELVREGTQVRTYVRDALSLMRGAYANAPEALWPRLVSVLETHVDAKEESGRMAVAQYAVAVFPPHHMPSRFLCLQLAGDTSEDVRQEAMRGLSRTRSTAAMTNPLAGSAASSAAAAADGGGGGGGGGGGDGNGNGASAAGAGASAAGSDGADSNDHSSNAGGAGGANAKVEAKAGAGVAGGAAAANAQMVFASDTEALRALFAPFPAAVTYLQKKVALESPTGAIGPAKRKADGSETAQTPLASQVSVLRRRIVPLGGTRTYGATLAYLRRCLGVSAGAWEDQETWVLQSGRMSGRLSLLSAYLGDSTSSRVTDASIEGGKDGTNSATTTTAAAAATATATSSTPAAKEDVGDSCDMYYALLMLGLGSEAGSELQTEALAGLLELAAAAPNVAPRLMEELPRLLPFVGSSVGPTRSAACRLIGHLSAHLPDAAHAKLLASLCKSADDNLDRPAGHDNRHGALLALGYVLGSTVAAAAGKRDRDAGLVNRALRTLAGALDDASETLQAAACVALGEAGRRGPLPLPDGPGLDKDGKEDQVKKEEEKAAAPTLTPEGAGATVEKEPITDSKNSALKSPAPPQPKRAKASSSASSSGTDVASASIPPSSSSSSFSSSSTLLSSSSSSSSPASGHRVVPKGATVKMVTKSSISAKLILLTSRKPKSGKTTLVEAAVLALGLLCVGEFPHPHAVAIEAALCATARLKSPELNFSVGEALACVGAGPWSTAGVDPWDLDSTVRDASRPEDAGESTACLEALLDTLFGKWLTHNVAVTRRAACVWLLCVVRFSGTHPVLLARLTDIQGAFANLLSEGDDFTQDVASKGLGLIYDMGDAERKAELVKMLVGQLTSGKRAKTQKFEQGSEDKVFEEGALGEAKGGGGMSTYKELCSIAADLNQPELVYKFMHLANHNMMWNSRKGAAFGFGKIAAVAGKELERHLPTLVPRLYRYQYDPSSAIRDSMKNIWSVLVTEPTATVDRYVKEILAELQKSLTAKAWRERESAASAVSDLLRGRTWKEVGAALPDLWRLCFRVIDDVKESVRKAGDAACKRMMKLTVRLCSAEAAGAQASQRALEALLPVMMGEGLVSPVNDVRAISLNVMIDMAKEAGDSIKPHLTTLITTLLEAMSGMESPYLDYLGQRLSRKEGMEEQLDDLRMAASKSSPLTRCMEDCVAHVDAGVLEELVPPLITMIKKGLGASTRAGCALLVQRLVQRCRDDLTPYSRKLLRALLSAATSRSAPVRRDMAAAAGDVIKVADARAIESLLKKAQAMYLEHETTEAVEASAIVCRAISRSAPDVLRAYATDMLPLAFVGMHDTSSVVRDVWSSVWSEHAAGMEGGVRLYMGEVLAMTLPLLDSRSWDVKRQAADTLAAVAKHGREEQLIKQGAPMQAALEAALPGRIWEGKAAVVDALAGLVASCAKHYSKPEVRETLGAVVRALLRECTKKRSEYRNPVLRHTGSALTKLDPTAAGVFFEDAAEVALPLLSTDDGQGDAATGNSSSVVSSKDDEERHRSGGGGSGSRQDEQERRSAAAKRAAQREMDEVAALKLLQGTWPVESKGLLAAIDRAWVPVSTLLERGTWKVRVAAGQAVGELLVRIKTAAAAEGNSGGGGDFNALISGEQSAAVINALLRDAADKSHSQLRVVALEGLTALVALFSLTSAHESIAFTAIQPRRADIRALAVALSDNDGSANVKDRAAKLVSALDAMSIA